MPYVSPSHIEGRNVIAVILSDIHFSSTCPILRSPANKSWINLQYLIWCKLKHSLNKLGIDMQRAELCIAGDVFDRWDEPPETISLAIQCFKYVTNKPVFAIAGQHDLPYHSNQQKQKSCYGVLVAAGIIRDLTTSYTYPIFPSGWHVYGAPWGEEASGKGIKPNTILLQHKYAYKKDDPEETGAKFAPSLRSKAYSKFAFCAFGDNHRPWYDGNMVNCGTFFVRKMNELKYSPVATILMNNGNFSQIGIWVGPDESFASFGEAEDENSPAKDWNLDNFIKSLESAQDENKYMSFDDAVRLLLKHDTKVPKSVRKILGTLIDEC